MKLEEAISYLRTVIKVNNDIVKEARKNGDINAIELTADLDTQSIAIKTALEALKNSIPKKKIEDKIKETNNKIEEYVKKKEETNNFMNFYSNEILKLNGKLFGYKELLEGE